MDNKLGIVTAGVSAAYCVLAHTYVHRGAHMSVYKCACAYAYTRSQCRQSSKLLQNARALTGT